MPFSGSSPLASSATRGRVDAHHGLHERRAHVGELDEVLGPDGDVRAAVEQQERLAGHGHEHGERRPVDAARALDVEQAGGERGAGGAAGDERVGAAVGDGRARPGRSRPSASTRTARAGSAALAIETGASTTSTPGRGLDLRRGAEDAAPARRRATAASAAPRATSRGPASAPLASSATVSGWSAAMAARGT